MDDIAKKFYPNQRAAQATSNNHSENEAEQTTDHEKALRLYGEGAAAENGTYGSVIKEKLNDLASEYGFTPTEVDHLRVSASNLYSEMEMSTTDATLFNDVLHSQIRNPVDEDQRRQWQKEARTLVREKYGKSGEERMNLVKQYISQNEPLKEMIEVYGLGDHPKIVGSLLDRAYNLPPIRRTRR